MTRFLNFYQHLPGRLDSIAFHIGSFSVAWYSLTYIAAFAVIYLLLIYRIKKKEAEYGRKLTADFIFYAFAGLIIGARLGYVIFYNFSYYSHHPLLIISPYDSSGNFTGIYGMSYHGGLIGVIIASILFARKNRTNFWRLADFIVPAIPAGYFFGRIGNFLNGELYGRATQKWTGMFFPAGGPVLRHPSQLYEALFEGLVLFLILWLLRNKKTLTGYFLALYFISYGSFRFILEFFREPDPQIGLILKFFTEGQLLSLIMFLAGLGIIFWRKRKIIF